jgi:GNAT superfamily N-acetyltransferase
MNPEFQIEKKPTFTIELPKIGDEVAIGPMHVQSWTETYINDEFGITEEVVEELIGHVATDTDFRKNTLIEALAHPDRVLYRVIKNSKDEIVGFFHGSKNNAYNELDGVYLLNEVKGTGIGGKLMEEFLAWADKDKPCHLIAFSFNEKALGFYAKYGFTKTDAPIQLYKDKLPFIEMVRSAENSPKPL